MYAETERRLTIERLASVERRIRFVQRPRLVWGAMMIVLAAALVLSVTLVVRAAPPDVFPSLIPLPTGFQPEGVATGRGPVLYAGSLANGAIYRVDLRSGEGEILFDGEAGRIAVGLSYDARGNRLFVAGGGTGKGYVYDGCSGEPIEEYDLTAPGTFVNDVVVTRSGTYLTNSFLPEFYRVALAPNGALPSQAEVVPLGGEWVQVAGFNANGIDATADGAWLVIVNSTTGTLYRVDPETGNATTIDLGGVTVMAGDGILLEGKTLYVVQNRMNQIAVIELADDLLSGTIVRHITDRAFDVPTTVTGFGNALYAVNARFGNPDPGNADYDVVRVLRQ